MFCTEFKYLVVSLLFTDFDILNFYFYFEPSVSTVFFFGSINFFLGRDLDLISFWLEFGVRLNSGEPLGFLRVSIC